MNRLMYIFQRSLNYQRALAIAQNEFKPKWTQLQWQPVRQQKTDAVKAAATPADEKKKKSKEAPKITLLSHNQGISVTTLEEAQKLAKRRDLRLLMVQELDTKTQRPVYKLVTQAEMLAEELNELNASENKGETTKNKGTQMKSEKSLTIGSRITEHDLSSRLKNITKWLAKRHEVRILIEGRSEADVANCDKIAKAIEKSVKEPELIGRIVQKRTKGFNIKFNILPVMATVPPTTTAPEARKTAA